METSTSTITLPPPRFFLGHNRKEINRAVVEVFGSGASLYGVGASTLEGDLAERLCTRLPHLERVGYNGNADELACNTSDPIGIIGSRVSPGEYPCRPIGDGTVHHESHFSHAVNFNDLRSVRWVCERFEIAALVREPASVSCRRPQAISRVCGRSPTSTASC